MNVKTDLKKRFHFIKWTLFMFLLVNMYLSSYAADGYSFYKDDGKVGILYNGEPCLLPIFDKASDIVAGLFVFEKDGKWGISNVWKVVKDPFCDSIKGFSNNKVDEYSYSKEMANYQQEKNIVLYMFENNGKWGVCAANGDQIIAPKYDRIFDKRFSCSDMGIMWKNVYNKKNGKSFVWNNKYFLVKEGNSYSMIDLAGTIVIPDITSFEYFNSQKGNKDLLKIAKKHELGRKFDKDATSVIKSIVKHISDATNENVLLFYQPTQYSKDYDPNKPREICFGCKNGILVPAEGEMQIVGGMKSIVNNYGFISTPLVYCSPEERIKRNPMDIYAYIHLVDAKPIQVRHYVNYIDESDVNSGAAEQDLILLQSKIKSFTELMEMTETIGDNDGYQEAKKRKDDTQNSYNKYKKNYDYAVSTMKFNAKVDRIANAATSIVNSLAAIAASTNTSSTSYSSSSSISSNSKGKNGSSIGQENATQMSLADQVNYNSLRNTYKKWASDLMQMKTLSGKYQRGYTINDKNKAQSEMKRLRKDSMNKWGKEIPYDSIEDWNP